MTVNKQVKNETVGIWLIGAYGDISTTLIVGTHALAANITSETGIITSCSPFSNLGMVDFGQLRFGGCDIRESTLAAAAQAVCDRSKTFSQATLNAINDRLIAAQGDVITRPDFNWNPQLPGADSPLLSTLVADMRKALRDFRSKHNLSRVIVVNVASAEPVTAPTDDINSLAGFERLIATNAKSMLAPSDCQTYAALAEGCPYLNFTPTRGAEIPALRELATQNKVPFYGNDGKTGETLIKTALAPMFAYRNLHVMSWEGVNLLGNGDGATLAQPENRESKLANKGNVLHKILGYPVHSGVTINYVPSLGDWKTAWDLIHFRGFLDVPMTMQFTWQGCDSILAAPLILDMIRFADFAQRQNEHGAMRHLSGYFKNPIDVEEHGFYRQFQSLLDYAQRHLSGHGLGPK